MMIVWALEEARAYLAKQYMSHGRRPVLGMYWGSQRSLLPILR